MKEFLKVLRRFALPYKGYIIGAIIANLLSAVMNVFSFMSIMPMLNMLFGMDTAAYDLFVVRLRADWLTPVMEGFTILAMPTVLLVVLVAILAVTIAVCFYLISLKDKGDK